ncbi:MAG: ribose-5-phosphate isomerase [Pseudoclavibacter sp.]|jgi:ribose 5-phosphate isomerase B
MVKPRVHIGTDHAGLDLSHRLIGMLREDGYEVVDHGPQSFDPLDDYPGFCIAAAEGVAADAHQGIPAFGIVIGGSGNGEQMAANKVAGIRAALVWNDDTARLARAHNDANVVSIGARQHTPEAAIDLVRTFLAEPFSGDARHVRRIGQIAAYEAERSGA